MNFLFLASLISFVIGAAAQSQPSRPENPFPTFDRGNLSRLNLNGEWKFSFSDGPERTIQVPFAPETQASGVFIPEFDLSKQDFIYQKRVKLPESWSTPNRLVLHFGSVSHECTVEVNGKLVGTHIGSYDPFSFDVTDAVRGSRDVQIVVRATNPIQDATIIRGKQEIKFEEGNIFYRTSSGITETVWLEKVAPISIQKANYLAKVSDDYQTGTLTIDASISAVQPGSKFIAIARQQGKIVAQAFTTLESTQPTLYLDFKKLQLWSPDHPTLYDLELILESEDGKIMDRVLSYAGLKKLEVKNGLVYLNGKRFYQQLILDQQYYNEATGYTPASLAEASRDIDMPKRAGFNGARFHQQTAPAMKRTLADQKGYVFWAELPSSRDLRDPQAKSRALQQLDALVQSVNKNPSLIGVTIFNESWGLDQMSVEEKRAIQIEFLKYVAPKLRPDVLVSINDGWEQISFVDEWGNPVVELEEISYLRGRLVSAFHNYPWYSEHMLQYFAGYDPATMVPGSRIASPHSRPIYLPGFGYDPQAPMFYSEFGGVSTYLKPGELPSNLMYYGPVERSVEDFRNRVGKQLRALGDLRIVTGGSTLTQAWDTGKEINGLGDENRIPKTDLEYFRAIQSEVCNKILGTGKN